MSKVPRATTSEAPHILAEALRFADHTNKKMRHTFVTSLIGQARSEGFEIDAKFYSAAGYRDANEYWHVAMSEPMNALSFAQLLAVHLSDPVTSDNSVLNMNIESAFCLALKTGEPWFIRVPYAPERGPSDLNRLMLHPRTAAEWLLSMPRRGHLVPPGLRAFLESSKREGITRRPRVYRTSRAEILSAARELGKPPNQYPTFKAYMRALCTAAGVDPAKRGWSEDSVRNALKGAPHAENAES
jgi:hypothetical protein